MFSDERYDFSLESDLKERLWDKMQNKMKQAAPHRSEVSFESISPAKAAAAARETRSAPVPAKGRNMK